MSMTTVNAKIYIARIIGGGANSQEPLDMAGEALIRGYQDWQNKKFWRFLLKDTSNATLVAGCTVQDTVATVNAPSTGAFDFVNVGQTVTISTAGTNTPTLAADTTVSSVTRGADDVITSITLSNPFATSGPDSTGNTLSFSANIPVLVGVNDYNLPADFNAPFTARLTTNPRPLTWRDQRWWDKTILNQTVQGTPTDYTTYNPRSALSQNYGTWRLKFDRIPSEADVLALRYYRRFVTDGTNVDMPDEYLYQFLDYCRNILLATKRAMDDPQGYATHVGQAAEGAAQDDEEPTDDDLDQQRMKSQFEVWAEGGGRPLWNNGAFDPYR